MIQDIEPNKLLNEYDVDKKIEENDNIIICNEIGLFIRNNKQTLEFPTYKEIKEYCEKNKEDIPKLTYLFKIEEKYFLCENKIDINIDGYEFCKMYNIRSLKNKEKVFGASTAWHLNKWYNVNKFCGKCGSKTEKDKKERMLKCKKCGNMIFPTIAPAVIVGVTDKDKILLTKYANRDYKRYALIAGFTEIGESVEETVKREVREEVGVEVKNIKYYKSQPWGFDSNLLLGFFAELDGERKIVMDKEELSVAEWVDRKDVPEDKEKLSLTGEMMTVFKNNEIN